MAILGVDNNTLVCESRIPSLSSVGHNAERIGYEAVALLDTRLTLKEIADVTGFRRATYLTNVFTSEAGMPPCAWRRARQRGA